MELLKCTHAVNVPVTGTIIERKETIMNTNLLESFVIGYFYGICLVLLICITRVIRWIFVNIAYNKEKPSSLFIVNYYQKRRAQQHKQQYIPLVELLHYGHNSKFKWRIIGDRHLPLRKEEFLAGFIFIAIVISLVVIFFIDFDISNHLL